MLNIFYGDMKEAVYNEIVHTMEELVSIAGEFV